MSTLNVTVTITARQESLIIRLEGENTDPLVIEAKRQLDIVVGSHWKWTNFPVAVNLCVEINGKEHEFPTFIAHKMRELIAQAKIAVEKILRQSD